MSTDSAPSRAPQARQASLVPDKPSLDGIEDKWSRRWEESGVVHV
jgi:valyl-tRNA synthetase